MGKNRALEDYEINLTMYTDGGSINNGEKEKGKPVYGSLCAIIVEEESDTTLHETVNVFKNVTNNQMEISAVIQGLEDVLQLDILDDLESLGNPSSIHIRIYSDSQYVVSGYNEWLDGWIAKGWRNSQNQPTPNKKFWKLLLDMIATVEDTLKDDYYIDDTLITFHKVKGHAGKSISKEKNKLAYYNERCDTLLSEALDRFRKPFK